MQPSLFWQLHVSYLHLWGRRRQAVREGRGWAQTPTCTHRCAHSDTCARSHTGLRPCKVHIHACTHTHVCLHKHAQQLRAAARQAGSGSARAQSTPCWHGSGGKECTCGSHPPCNSPRGPRLSGTGRRGSLPSSGGSTSARHSWLERGSEPQWGQSPPAGLLSPAAWPPRLLQLRARPRPL